MAKRTFEDFIVGESFVLPPQRISREEIIAFAREFDPQPFHLDEHAPATELSGGLIASGWHVSAVFMRALCDGLLLDSACLGSPGIETLKWQRPVRPGDTLAGKSTVIETRASQTRPDRGIIRFRHEAANQDGEVVMWMHNPVFFARRGAA
jgi:acyl dehydratase